MGEGSTCTALLDALHRGTPSRVKAEAVSLLPAAQQEKGKKDVFY